MNLRYDDMLLNRDGSVMSEERIRDERRRRGFCTECRINGEPPVRLFSINTNRFNPLWKSQVPLTVQGESLDGKCLRCHPELNPNRHRRSGNRRSTTSANRRSERGTDHTSRPLQSSIAQRTGQPAPMNQPLGHGPTERSPPMEQTQDQGHGNRNEAENNNGIITAAVRWAQNGAIPSVSSPALGCHASQEQPPASSNAPSSEQLRPRPLASSLFNSPSALVAISVPQLSGADEPSTTSSACTRNSDENSVSSSTRHDSDRLAQSMRVDEGTPGSPSTNSERDGDNSEHSGDHVEIMFDRLRRQSSVRPLRQSFVANLMPPPSDSSPVLSHLLRTAAMTASNNNSNPASSAEDRHSTSSAGRDSTSRLMSVSTSASSASSASSRSRFIPTDTLNDRLARNLEVPPDDDQFENSSTEASASPLTQSPPPTPANEQAIVEELRSLVRDLHHGGSHDIAVDILVEAMKGYAGCSRVQEFCLATLWDLGKDYDQFRASVMTSSVPDDILLCMKHNLDNAAIQEQACGALWALSIDQANRRIIIQAGATARVIKCIADHQNNANVIRAAMGCLRTLSPEPEVRVSTGVLDGVKHVCAAMKTNRSVAGIQVDGCALLSNLAVDLVQQLVALATDEEIEVIVGAIVAHPTDQKVTSGACFALKNYSYDERNLRKLMQVVGIVQTLQAVVAQEREPGSRCYASGLLERFDAFAEDDALLEDQVVTSLEESIVSTIHSGNAVSHALGVLAEFDWSSKVTAAGLRCLVTMISEVPSTRHLITEEILTNIVDTMTKMMRDSSVIAHGCEFLELFAREKVNLRSAIINAGACTTILKAMMLDVHDVVLQRAATGVLRFLSKDWECCMEIHRQRENLLNNVLAVCPEDLTVYHNVSAIKENLSDMLGSSSA
ncbi:hypothetical protein MHU86_3781 [Fragilaria crotonensis]|nr:hypothetical protein MHU86_3781 [Fragilaria crotonensis]